MKKKVLIFSLAYYPKHVGGAEVAIKEITNRLGNEIEFHMVTNRFDSSLPKVEQVGNILVHRIGITKDNPTMADLKKMPLHLNKLIFQFYAAFYAYKLNRENKYDAAWAMMAQSCAVPANIFNSLSKVPFVLTLQEGDTLEHIKQKMKPFGNLFTSSFKKAHSIQAISTFLSNWAISMGAKKDSVSIVPNGVNFEKFSKKFEPSEILDTQDKFKRQGGDVFLITTSRLVKKNGIGYVVDALAKANNNIKFLIIGDGPDKDKLISQVKELGLQDRVIFYGYMDISQIPIFLKSCDIFIRPSLSEGFGNSFIEAMAAEVPVISTTEGGIADFLFGKDDNSFGQTGWVVRKQNSDDIVEQIENIINDKENTKNVIARAKKMVFEKYDWDNISDQMKQKVFSGILNR